jgi:hypothetical protein
VRLESYQAHDANHITEVACRAVVPLPSVTRRVAVRLVVALLALALLIPAAAEANDSPSFKAAGAHAVVAKKKKRKRCKKYRWVRVRRHGHFIKRHGRYVRVRRCAPKKKKQGATTTPVQPPAQTPPGPGFTVGLVSGPSPVWESNLLPSLHPRMVRFETSIDTPASQLAQYVGGMAAKGTEVIVLASFYGRIPSTSEAQNLASWAKAYGPGGTFWKGRSDGQYAMRYIEFGNETNQSYQFNCGPGCSGYRSRAQQYATRAKEAGQAIAAANPNTKLLAIGEDANCDCSEWVDGMFSAVPDLNKWIGGWSLHPYGPKSRYGPILNQLVKDTTKHGDTTLPFIATEYGISSDNGRCLSQRFDWPSCMTYAQAGANLLAAVADMHATYPRLRAVMIYNQRDQANSGASGDYEDYYGAMQKGGAPKGAYTSAVQQLLATYRSG